MSDIKILGFTETYQKINLELKENKKQDYDLVMIGLYM